jgi:hypothetical protein
MGAVMTQLVVVMAVLIACRPPSVTAVTAAFVVMMSHSAPHFLDGFSSRTGAFIREE